MSEASARRLRSRLALDEEAGVPEEVLADVEHKSARALLTAAILCFADRGFHGTTTRDIAARAGMSPGALYVHYASKEDVLFEICFAGHADARRTVEGAVAAAAPDAGSRLRAAVHALASWHAQHHVIGRVIQFEMRALPPARHELLLPERRAINTTFRSVLERGVDEGRFDVPDVSGTVMALISLSSDVARWFRPEGDRSWSEVAELYADLAVRAVRLQG